MEQNTMDFIGSVIEGHSPFLPYIKGGNHYGTRNITGTTE